MGEGNPRLPDRVREAMRVRYYSRHTADAYLHWIRRFVHRHDVRPPAKTGEEQINVFSTHLGVREGVSSSTHNHTLEELFLLYRHVVGRAVSAPGKVLRARRTAHVPAVLTRGEAGEVLSRLFGRFVADLVVALRDQPPADGVIAAVGEARGLRPARDRGPAGVRNPADVLCPTLMPFSMPRRLEFRCSG